MPVGWYARRLLTRSHSIHSFGAVLRHEAIAALTSSESSSILLGGQNAALTQHTRDCQACAGKEIVDLVLDRLRKLADNCTGLQGFMSPG